MEDQERLRRSRVLSWVFLLVPLAILLILPAAFSVSIYWLPIFTLTLFFLIAFFCNRFALINLSGLFCIVAVDATLAILMIALPRGIENSDLPDFDLFLIATLIGGFILPRQALPWLALFHIALIIALFVLLPHDPLLVKEIQVNQNGSAYGVINDALILQIVGAVIAWLNASSVEHALLRASRAEELAEAQKDLNEQVRCQVEQKERLEYGINVLKEAHARFANGDYHARAILYDNELASLAISFNLLADRLNRIARIAQDYTTLEAAFQQLFAIQEEVVYSGKVPRVLPPTGTQVDRIYPWLKQYYLFRQAYSRCGTVLDKARFALTRQRAVLAQLQADLDQIRVTLRQEGRATEALAPTLELIEKARLLCAQVEERGKQGLQEAKNLDLLLKV
ncbi:MAG TPA: hypothetical protein VF458_16440 [Ktedonobacteraceae bacterium]